MNKASKLLIAILLVATSCSSDKKPAEDPDDWRVIEKSYTNWYGGSMPTGICLYTYGHGDKTHETEDSCSKYNIGDLINH